MDKPAVEIETVCFSYGNTHVLKKIAVTIEHGEYIAIIGPNGGGKSTFLNLIMGFLKPNSGKVYLFGKNPVSMRKRLGYVPQMLHYDRRFPITVEEMVLMGEISKHSLFGKYPEGSQDRCREVLEKIDLLDQISTPIHALSGGQMQRALIARALITDPDILLLDEPTASIDKETEQKLLELLISFKGKKTILMVTHNLHAWLSAVDRVFCIQEELCVMKPKDVCHHHAMGSYHTPEIIDEDCSHD